MKIINHFLIIILTLSKIHGIELPVNSSERNTISNWVIAKVENINEYQTTFVLIPRLNNLKTKK